MRCPKCGRGVAEDQVICSHCEYILDPSFLGADITNEPVGDLAAEADGFDDADDSALRTVATPFGGDALILGDLDDVYSETFTEETGSYLSAGGEGQSVIGGPAVIYVGASAAALITPDAVLGILPEVDLEALALTPFETHVASFINGENSFATIAADAGLALDDLKIAVTMLAEKKAVGLVKREDVELSATASAPGIDLHSLDQPTGKTPSLVSEISNDMDIEDVPEMHMPPPPGVPGAGQPSAKQESPTEPKPGAGPKPAARPAAAANSEPKPKPARPLKKKVRVPPAARKKARKIFEQAQEDIKAGRMVRALQFAKLAAKLDPGEEEFSNLIDNWNDAKQAAEPDPNQSEDLRLFHEAEETELAGDHHGAVRLLRDAIKVNPDNAHVHNRLGVILATRLKDFSNAMSSLFRAVELEPENQSFRNNLGKVLARAEGKKASEIDIDELLTGQSKWDREQAMKDAGKKRSWTALAKKKW